MRAVPYSKGSGLSVRFPEWLFDRSLRGLRKVLWRFMGVLFPMFVLTKTVIRFALYNDPHPGLMLAAVAVVWLCIRLDEAEG